MIFQHNLDPNQFAGKTKVALKQLLEEKWNSTNIADVNTAFYGLYDRHSQIANKSNDGVADPTCVEIRRCMHALADVWADLWLQRGTKIFHEKLDYYYRKARFERSNAHDELLYQALKKLDEGRMRPIPRAG